jgi:WhiB family redox-sensing transcriptional regulator
MTETWRELAACRKADVNLFFMERGDNGGNGRMEKILSFCNNCKVKTECLYYAVDNHIDQGIFGGLSARARRSVRRERKGY